ncbi:hypothetical protein [Synechococcus sp. CS-1328]|uniref:hypothetical protein n=1 Tax=Synechococcus sp. CS-1328 TaxID=2847976 RepID=UPI00223BA8D1|nr:hypothetical protein [Synechococcus sp. CS-1328]MCT0224546.1 hypothetical protein [Synechococcus sp. CS-1328]
MFPAAPASLLLSLIGAAVAAGGLTAPAGRAQMLLDAAAAGSVQNSLQQQSGASYGKLLEQTRQRLSGGSGTAPGGTPATADSGGGRNPVAAGSGAAGAPATGAVAAFVINDRPVPLCSSGLPCLGVLQRAMGLGGRPYTRGWRY